MKTKVMKTKLLLVLVLAALLAACATSGKPSNANDSFHFIFSCPFDSKGIKNENGKEFRFMRVSNETKDVVDVKLNGNKVATLKPSQETLVWFPINQRVGMQFVAGTEVKWDFETCFKAEKMVRIKFVTPKGQTTICAWFGLSPSL